MRIATLVLTAALAATPALASDTADIAATVNKYNDSFNKGDTATFASLCSAQTIIIDDFAPHAWQGANACMDWANALMASDKAAGISNEKVTLGKIWHVSATGDRGYAVYPTTYTYKLKGKPTTEHGVWTFALQKQAQGWRIAGWAWAQH